MESARDGLSLLDEPHAERRQRVCAVVVTHNRLELLRECLEALAAQSRPLASTLVVDNASSDGTADAVAAEFPDARVVRLPHNVGGAGGFARGIEAALDDPGDWLWLMDDDTLPAVSALERLLSASERAPAPPSVLASRVLWRDGRLHPMNIPAFDRRAPDRVLDAATVGLVPIRSTTFVSALVSVKAVQRHGLPPAHYFIWHDDVDYTGRILAREPGYLVPDSLVEHMTTRPAPPVEDTGERFYFFVRNRLLSAREPHWSSREKLEYYAGTLLQSVRYVRGSAKRVRAARLVLRGLISGLRSAGPGFDEAMREPDGRTSSSIESRDRSPRAPR